MPPVATSIENVPSLLIGTTGFVAVGLTPISAERLELTLLLSLVFVHRKANWMRYPLSHGIR